MIILIGIDFEEHTVVPIMRSNNEETVKAKKKQLEDENENYSQEVNLIDDEQPLNAKEAGIEKAIDYDKYIDDFRKRKSSRILGLQSPKYYDLEFFIL